MVDIVTKLNTMMLNGASIEEMIEACAWIDIGDCFEPVIEPPIDFIEKCRKRWERSLFRTTIEKKIGNTWYLIETECAGEERLSDKVKRLIFSDKGVVCS